MRNLLNLLGWLLIPVAIGLFWIVLGLFAAAVVYLVTFGWELWPA